MLLLFSIYIVNRQLLLSVCDMFGHFACVMYCTYLQGSSYIPLCRSAVEWTLENASCHYDSSAAENGGS